MADIADKILIIILWVLGASLLLVILFQIGVRVFKLIMRFWITEDHEKGVLLKISLPKYNNHQVEGDNSPQTPQQESKSVVAEQMFSELRGISPSDWKKHLVFRESFAMEIVATATEINFYTFCSRKLMAFVKDTIFAAYPEAEITEVEDYFNKLPLEKAEIGYVRMIGPSYTPIRTYETMTNDSLNPILNKMVNLKGGEVIAVQTYFTPVSGGWRNKGLRFLNYLSNRQNSSKNESSTVWVGNSPQMNVDRDVYSGVEKKMNKKGYLVGIRIISISDDKQIAKDNFNSIARSYSQFDPSSIGSFQGCQFWLANFDLLKYYKLRMQPFIDWHLFKQQFIANTEEAASLYHFPGEDVVAPKIAWQRYKTALGPNIEAQEGLFLGYNRFRGDKKKVFINKVDRRRHFYMVGQTGTGKSEMLKHMILQDIKNGEGVAFVDPHGDVVEDILTKIPKERMADVIYWNPGDTEYPMGMNIMDVETIEQKNIIINSFIALLYKLYDPNKTGIMGPMLERTVRNVMLTAMEEKGSTLIEALRLLTSPEYAKSKVDGIKDPLVKTYWTEQMARTSDFHKSETLGYYISKFDKFVTDITLRNIIGQSKSAFNFRQIMDEGKILLVNLAKGKLGEENTSFLGTLMVPKFMIAAMSRSEIPEDQRKDFYLYIDEFQSFSTPDFVGILSEARKYRLNLIVANQYISQIRSDVKDAIFGNVGSMGAFRVGVDDANYLIHHFGPIFNEFDLINNGIGNMYLKLLIGGKPSEPFSVSLDWQEVKNVPSDVLVSQEIVKQSREKYARKRLEIEKEIVDRANFIS